MAGTATTTARTGADGQVQTIRFVMVSNSSGAVSGHGLLVRDGQLTQVKIIPDAGGTQPTDLFDLTLTDGDGVDLLAGAGANQSNAAPVVLQCDPPIPVVGPLGAFLDVVVANAGNAKGLTVVLVTELFTVASRKIR